MIKTAATELYNATYGKVARRLIPFLFLCYILAFIDRVNVSFAKLQMLNDLQFSETVYGLGADATKPAAVRAIYAAKGRPAGHPLIVHVQQSSTYFERRLHSSRLTYGHLTAQISTLWITEFGVMFKNTYIKAQYVTWIS